MLETIKIISRKLGVLRVLRWVACINPLRHRPTLEERRRNHPEWLAVQPYCVTGRGIDVGCGNWKSHPNCIGVDILPKGVKGQHGCVKGLESQADVCASGDDLSMFKTGELDFVVARHNLEHYVDVIKTLREWKRVLRTGGTLVVIVPDERVRNTIELDPTHKHAFTALWSGRPPT